MKRLTPSEVAALPCSMCGEDAFTTEQKLDGAFLDRVAADIARGTCYPCAKCGQGLLEALRRAPVMLVPIPQDKGRK